MENRVDKSIKISLEYIRITSKADCLSLWLEWFCWNFILCSFSWCYWSDRIFWYYDYLFPSSIYDYYWRTWIYVRIIFWRCFYCYFTNRFKIYDGWFSRTVCCYSQTRWDNNLGIVNDCFFNCRASRPCKTLVHRKRKVKKVAFPLLNIYLVGFFVNFISKGGSNENKTTFNGNSSFCYSCF